ncbi:MAG: MFS transporter, partial [Sneathiella sp.]
GMPFWLYLCRALGKHRAWGVAMILACGAFAFVPFLAPQCFVLFGFICFVTGASLGAELAIPPAIQTDVADWDNFLNKADRSSFLFSLWSMATKLSLGLGVGIAYLVLGTAETPPVDGDDIGSMNLTLLVVIYSVVPIVLKLSALGMMWGFPLNAVRHRAIRNRLERREDINSPV